MKRFGVLSQNRHALHTSDTTVHPDWGRSDRVVVLRAFVDACLVRGVFAQTVVYSSRVSHEFAIRLLQCVAIV